MTATHEPPSASSTPEEDKKAPACSIQTGLVRHSRWQHLFQQKAQYALVFFGAVATAFGSLVAEDTFPQEDHFSSDFKFSIFRIALFIAFLGLAIYATRQLTKKQLNRGTLYYLRFQSETNPDFHEDVVDEARSEYLDFRSASAWCDPALADSYTNPHRVVDVRQQLEEMSRELQRAVNDDARGSGFDIAPNLLFPAGLALGYDWMPPGRVTLRELNKKSEPDPPTTELSIFQKVFGDIWRKQKCISEPSETSDPEDFQWTLHKANLTGTAAEVHSKKGKQPMHSHLDITSSHSYRLCSETSFCTWVTSSIPLVGRDHNDDVRSVWLEFRLTNQDYTGSVQDVKLRNPHKKRMESKLKDSADVHRIIHVAEFPDESSSGQYRRLNYSNKLQTNDSGLTILQIAEASAYWIARTLRDFPNATVFIAAATPKTLPFVTGYFMNQVPVGKVRGKIDPVTFPWFQSDGPYHPWQRIVPMGHFLGENPELRPMWVRDDQIDPNVLIERAFGSNEEATE